jgi:hypothetical protein
MKRLVPLANTINRGSSDNDIVMVEQKKRKKPQVQINSVFTNIVIDGSTQSDVEAKLIRRMP